MGAEWYIVNVASGYENKVAKAIRDEAKKRGIDGNFEEIIVPVETYLEARRGKMVDVQRKILPGYIIVRMVMSEDAWGLVKRIPNVAKFLGADSKPARISDKEVQLILSQIKESADVVVPTAVFRVGEVVRIMDGPFETFTGVVEGVDKDKLKLNVLVSILGHDASMELEFRQVEKIDK